VSWSAVRTETLKGAMIFFPLPEKVSWEKTLFRFQQTYRVLQGSFQLFFFRYFTDVSKILPVD